MNKLNKGRDKVPQRAGFPNQPEKYITNLTTLQLSPILTQALSLGQKFCYRQPPATRLEEEVQFESLCQQTNNLVPTSQTNAEQFQSILVDCCYQYRCSKDNKQSILTKAHTQELKQLRQNKDIILARPDKGAGIVLMNRNDYLSKMNCILNDRSKFKKLENNKDRMCQIENKLTKLLKALLKEAHISLTEFESLKPTGSQIPRLYGL
ncbi:MAG: hypothetical protein ACRCTW_06610, partial [Lactococcus garvieae]